MSPQTSSPSAALMPPIEIINQYIFGPILIGLVVSALLTGVTIVQAAVYMRNSKYDPLGQKLAIWFLCSLDALHISFMVHMIYHYLVSDPTDEYMIWSFPAHVFIETLLFPVAQWLYIVRIWKIATHRRKWIPAILSVLVFSHLVVGIFASVKMAQHANVGGTNGENPIPSKPAIAFVLAMTTFIDFSIAGSLIHTLPKAGTNLRWTDSSITMLLAYFLHTGVIISIFSLSVFIAFMVSKNPAIFLAIEAVDTRLYVNSVLGMVNARYYFQPPQSPKPLSLHSETSSQYGPIDMASRRLSKTINEVGLPLFQPSAKPEDVKVLEVMVKQEHSSKT
ncbi:hypothetical protein BDZ94DRAFT_1264425 [Collybia nuda]|uniref:DUF6534 domain-containing protein n=1 Tax=Collybia nuda TaxID=64659 RepID=A0A9P5Y2N2_9AGAR|nr:hypothetical protein BDZ94DRAFT_1264425 [Collybia nuda]